MKVWSDVQSCSQAEKPAWPTDQQLAELHRACELLDELHRACELADECHRAADAKQGGQPVEPSHSHGHPTTPHFYSRVTIQCGLWNPLIWKTFWTVWAWCLPFPWLHAGMPCLCPTTMAATNCNCICRQSRRVLIMAESHGGCTARFSCWGLVWRSRPKMEETWGSVVTIWRLQILHPP